MENINFLFTNSDGSPIDPDKIPEEMRDFAAKKAKSLATLASIAEIVRGNLMDPLLKDAANSRDSDGQMPAWIETESGRILAAAMVLVVTYRDQVETVQERAIENNDAKVAFTVGKEMQRLSVCLESMRECLML